MDVITNIFEKINTFLDPIIEGIIEFLLKDMNILYGAIILLVVILALVGLIRMIKKTPALLAILIVFLAAAVAMWYFFIFNK